MGYYTKFDLTAQHRDTWMAVDSETEEKMTLRLWELISGSDYFRPEKFEQMLEEPMKWYDHKNDMYTLSTEYPDYIFLLEGIGEEHDDQWRLYACDGVMEEVRAKIVYDAPKEQLFYRMHY